MPAIPGDDELPGKVLKTVKGIEGDLDALRGDESGGEQEKAGFLWIGRKCGGDWSVELDEIDPVGVVPVLEQAGQHEAGSDLDAEVGMVTDPSEAIGAGPTPGIAHGGPSATALEIMPEETRQAMGTMAGGEIAGHAIPAGTEPGLVVKKDSGREGGGFIDQFGSSDAVDLENIGLPLLTEGGEIAWISAMREGTDRAIDGDGTGVLVDEEDLMSCVLKEPAGLDDHPVRAPVVWACCFVDQDDAHGCRVPGSGGLEKNLKPGYQTWVLGWTGCLPTSEGIRGVPGWRADRELIEPSTFS